MKISPLQGLVGSGPQIVVQLVAVLYLRAPGPIQVLVFIIGMMVIGKSVVQYDVLYKEGTTKRDIVISFLQKLRYSFLVSPIYLTSMVFRIGSLGLLIGYLRYFAILPIILHLVLLISVARMLNFEKKDIFLLACTNTCIMSVGPLKSSDDTKRQSRFKFVSYSSFGTLLIFTAFLIGLVYTVNTDYKFMAHWTFLLLSRCGNIETFNILSIFIVVAGFANLLLLCTAQWGRMDSYLDWVDMEDIMNSMGYRYGVSLIKVLFLKYNNTLLGILH